MIIINNILLSPEDDEKKVFDIAAKRLHGVRADRMEIRKKAIDTRRCVRLVYSVAAYFEDDKTQRRLCERDKNLVLKEETQALPGIEFKNASLPPVVVGFGPAGMFAALMLARAGQKPIILERGSSIEKRIIAVENFWAGGVLQNTNVQFGEGGAGTFSDGKLTTGINDPLCEGVLRELVRFGADKSILVKAKPHIGTDALRKIVKNIRLEIEKLGGRILFDTRLAGIKQRNGALCAAVTDDGEIPCDRLVLAIGHSARDTLSALLESGIEMEKKPFSVGVRLEQRQCDVDAAMYGRYAGHPMLPPAEYKLSYRENGRGVYSFCMCPGGYIVASASEQGGVVTNGMSYSGRDGENANAAIAVSVLPQDLESDVLSGVRFQQQLERAAFKAGGENYYAPSQTVRNFVNNQLGSLSCAVKPTYRPGVLSADFNQMLPSFVCNMLKSGFAVFDKRREGFNSINGILTGVETRTSSPVRILRGDDFQAPSCRGLYPCGEGAGYAGGIMSAAVDGIRVACAMSEQ